MFDPREEALYRYRLATNYLREAEEAFRIGIWRLVVASAQLSAENAAKAVIAFYRIPSWSHDPSNELLEILSSIPEDMRSLAEELANIANALAPEHGRITYGEPTRGLTPWEIYSEQDAQKALEMARKALSRSKKILQSLGVETL